MGLIKGLAKGLIKGLTNRMPPIPKNILLLYKNSTYAEYFLTEEIKRFRRTHATHSWSLSYVDAVLKRRKLKFTKACRGSSLDYNRFDLIITVGGDGTFLEAARHVKKGTVWGVNSDPSWSVGRFCSGNPENFEKLLDKILAGKAVIKKFNRLNLSFSDGTQSMDVLNDILICHHNPGAMSRYLLTIGKVTVSYTHLTLPTKRIV